MNIAEEESWQNPPRRKKALAMLVTAREKNRTFFSLAEVIRFSIVRFAVYAADADAK